MFSLINYLNEGILNERLSSSILLDLILNDKSETFKYYIPLSTSYRTENRERENIHKRIIEILKNLKSITNMLPYGYSYSKNITMPLNTVFATFSKYEHGKEFMYKIEFPATEEGMIEMNNIYLSLLDLLKSILTNLFNKPHLLVLEDVLDSKLNWANINDSNFTKYTVKQLKDMFKTNRKQYDDIIKNYTKHIFYFKEDNTFLGISRENNIRFYSLAITDIPFSAAGNLSAYSAKYDIKNYLKEKVQDIIKFIDSDNNYKKVMTLPSGKELFFLSRDFYDVVKELLEKLVYKVGYKDKFLTVGSNICASGSNVRKYLCFGDSNDDYILVFSEERDSKGSLVDTTSLTKNRKEKYNNSSTLSKYRWIKKLNGKYTLYADKLNTFYEFGHKVANNDFYARSNDNICNILAKNNFERYNAELTRIKALKSSVTYKKSLEELTEKLNPYFLKKYEANDKIFELMSTDIEKAKELQYAFGTYMALLNDVIKNFSNIKKIQTKLNIRMKEKPTNTYDLNSLASQIKTLNTQIQDEIDTINKNKLPIIEDLYKEITDFIDKN